MSSALGTHFGPHTPHHYPFGSRQNSFYAAMSSPLAQSSSSSSPSTRFHSHTAEEEHDDNDEDDDDELTASHAPASIVKGSLTRRSHTISGRSTNRSSPRQMLTPGPLGLSRPSGKEAESSASARLMKQQFRQKCQEAMALDRKRDRDRKVAQSRTTYRERAGEDSEEEEKEERRNKLVLNSDDLSSSSDIDESAMDDRELELARRILAGDYRRMLREQERSGELECGWLDPDEVAWLEDEVKREEARMQMQNMEPPADMIDEDEDLYAQYQHAQSSEGFDRLGEASEDDLYWPNDDIEWESALTGAEITPTATPRASIAIEDTVMEIT